MQNSLELLMPAGSRSKMKLALSYGADAVYLGPPFFSLRARDNHFHDEELQQSIAEVHALNKKVYMTLNIFARNRKLKPFSERVQTFAAMKPDAFIMSDPGFASIAKELAPEIPIHLSVQANCMNWKSVQFWQKSLGIERVILSRELAIEEIAEIKQRVPDIELEAFVHGSICIAYSGRCLLSSYMDRRDANQGVCDNSCREKFNVYTSNTEFAIREIAQGKNTKSSCQSSSNQDLYQIEEDEHGTYILNAKDLCMIEHLKPLIDAGVISFKVEGRTKSEFYAAMIARAYRGALDDVQNSRPFNESWLRELNKLSNRGYHTGFMLGTPSSEGQNYETSQQMQANIRFIGYIQGDADVLGYPVQIKNKVSVGQKIILVEPNQNYQNIENPQVLTVQAITNLKGQSKTEVHSGSGLFLIQFQEKHEIKPFSLLIAQDELHNFQTLEPNQVLAKVKSQLDSFNAELGV